MPMSPGLSNLTRVLQDMASDPAIVTKLIASVAPKVIDMDNVKKGLLCQLFGGVSKMVRIGQGLWQVG
jgi:DNA replicative helicase MCM subunit Mcm2 (Cdc46/Mcm family)